MKRAENHRVRREIIREFQSSFIGKRAERRAAARAMFKDEYKDRQASLAFAAAGFPESK